MKISESNSSNKIKYNESSGDVFKEYSNQFKDENYASIYNAELKIKANGRTSIRRQVIGSIIAYCEKRAVSRLLKYTEGDLIIDIPCGSGKLNPILEKKGCNIISADVSSQMIKFAKEGENRCFDFLLADIRFLPLRSESMDILISNRFLHRIPAENHEIILNELYRISKKYSILYFSSKTVFTSIIIALEEFFNIGYRGDIYYLRINEILGEIEQDNWHCVKKVRVLPLISTGVVLLVEKRSE